MAACGAPSAGPAPSSTASDPVSAPASASSATASASAAAPPLPIVLPDDALVARMRADVKATAIQRAPGSAGWLRVQTLIKDRLKAAGFEVVLDTFAGSGTSVIGTKKGANKPDEIVILSAHYDHIPGCAGADDNASGLAVVLEAARVLGTEPNERTLVLAFWDREEDGLIGSNAWATRAAAAGVNVRLMISLDGVGFADERANTQQLPDAVGLVLPEIVREVDASGRKGNFIAVIGDDGSEAAVRAFDRFGASHQLEVMGAALPALSRLALADAARSDHASFWIAGYPGILVTDTANFRNPNYHCGFGPDAPETLDYVFLAKTALSTIDVVRAALL